MSKFWILVLFLPSVVLAEELSLFTSDGCSMFPNGTAEQQSLWLNCCVQHDFAYWQGGLEKERVAADEALQQCVQAVGEPEIANLMLAGVRVGGSPYFPTSYRWGYGWPYPRGYKALTKEEKAQVHFQLQSLALLIASLQIQLKSEL